MNTFNTARISQTVTALSLSLVVTLALLGSLNGLATEQHATTVLAKSTAALQAKQALAVVHIGARG
jgi:hypothetical protein